MTAMSANDLNQWHLTRDLPGYEQKINQLLQKEAYVSLDDKTGKKMWKWKVEKKALNLIFESLGSIADQLSVFERYRAKGWIIEDYYYETSFFIFKSFQ